MVNHCSTSAAKLLLILAPTLSSPMLNVTSVRQRCEAKLAADWHNSGVRVLRTAASHKHVVPDLVDITSIQIEQDQLSLVDLESQRTRSTGNDETNQEFQG
jgi:hypothetical protein